MEGFEQISLELPRLNLPEWLSQQSLYPKVYIQERHSQIEHAALGTIFSCDFPPPHPARFYGGMHFPSTKEDILWKDFPKCAFWLPAFEIIQDEHSARLNLNFIDKKASNTLDIPRSSLKGSLLQQTDSISLLEWKKQIDFLLSALKNKELEKIVLGRKKELTFSQPPSAWEIIEQLKKKAHNATLFVFELKAQKAFLGATPEKLFYRKGRTVTIDAVAGTRPRGKTAEEDLFLESTLKKSAKEREEFLLVKDYIHSQLLPLAEKIAWLESDQILKTAHVQHFYNQATVQLKEEIQDRDLIAALHPTPAVGGISREKAVEMLSDMESFQRGWYAAPVGWISSEETNLNVAIRSGLLLDRTLHLFAAAGIVSGSVAEKEWEEIENKMRLLLYGCGLAE